MYASQLTTWPETCSCVRPVRCHVEQDLRQLLSVQVLVSPLDTHTYADQTAEHASPAMAPGSHASQEDAAEESAAAPGAAPGCGGVNVSKSSIETSALTARWAEVLSCTDNITSLLSNDVFSKACAVCTKQT